MTVTHINKLESHEVYTKLLIALGSENNPQQWLLFMTVMRQHLPFLMEKGKPTKTQYESSIIGGLGFASWKEMVESPLADGGLNWSINNWNKWNQAYNVVLNNPYLQDTNLTYVQILKLKSTFQKKFPESLEDLEAAQAQLKKDLAQSKIDSNNELKSKIAELEQQLAAANAKVLVLTSTNEQFTQLIDSVAQLKVANITLNKKHEELQSKNNELEHEAIINKTSYVNLKKHLSSMTLWQRIKAEFNI